MSGQKFWRDLIKHKYYSSQKICIQALSYPGNIFLGNCSIVTVLEGALSRKQNTRQNDEEENSGLGKLNIFHRISEYDQFFHGKSGSNTPPGGPFFREKVIKVIKSYKLSLIMHATDTLFID